MDKNKIKLIFKSEDGEEVTKGFDLDDMDNFYNTINSGIKKFKIIEKENEENEEKHYYIDYNNDYNIKQLSNGLLNFIEKNKKIIDDINLEYYVKTICNSNDIKKSTKIFFSVLLRFIEDNMQEYIFAVSNGLANNDSINFQLLENYVENIGSILDKFKESDLEEPEKEEQQKKFKEEENKTNEQLKEIEEEKNKEFKSLDKEYTNLNNKIGDNLKEQISKIDKELEDQKKGLEDKRKKNK